MTSNQLWKVIGGADKGGLIVRSSSDLSSSKLQTRLSTGSIIQEQERVGDRLHFHRLSGAGPSTGWISVRLSSKELLVKCSDNEVEIGKPAQTESKQTNQSIKPKAKETKIVSSKAAKALGQAEIPTWKGLTDAEWKEVLDPYAYFILRCDGTDAPGAHEYTNFFPEAGYFACAGCDLPLYSSKAKFHDHGWPAWDKCYYSDDLGCHVGTRNDGAVENHCTRCRSHLGHIFFGEHHTATNERH